MVRDEQRAFEVQLTRQLAETFDYAGAKDHASTRLEIETLQVALPPQPLRPSAYLCVLCVRDLINAEAAEIRRGPQRKLYLRARAVLGLAAAASASAKS